MTCEKMRRQTGIRWWPALLLLLAAGAGVAFSLAGDGEDQQAKVVGALSIGLLLPVGLFLWLVLFSRLPGRVRAGWAVGLIAAAAVFLIFFRVQGFTGN